ncbi:MAG TPA: hypothetical protein VFZ89_09500, partial [Solirubrobacteraceae bacterium]
EVRDRLRSGRAEVDFPYAGPGWLSISRTTPEAGIAVDEELVLQSVERAGLQLARPIARGSWSGHTGTAASFQDIVVLAKPR